MKENGLGKAEDKGGKAEDKGGKAVARRNPRAQQLHIFDVLISLNMAFNKKPSTQRSSPTGRAEFTHSRPENGHNSSPVAIC